MLPAIQRYAARQSIVGDDTPIARVLPQRDRRMICAWCFLDHAGPVQFAPTKGLHVGAHPHIGLQTFTWMIEGEVLHRDSLGYEQIIRPGQVNLMTAGRGVAHTEDSLQDGSRLHAVQLWIALPEAECQREPAFCNYADLPTFGQGGFRATLLAGEFAGRRAPTQVFSPLVGLDLSCAGPASAMLPLDATFEYGALVLRGEATVAGESLAASELLYVAPGRHELAIEAGAAAQILLLGGTPFDEDIMVWWNFVARTQQDLVQALADWNANPNGGGRFGQVRSGSHAAPLRAPSLEGVQLKPR